MLASSIRCDPPRRSSPRLSCFDGRNDGRLAACWAVRKFGKASRKPIAVASAIDQTFQGGKSSKASGFRVVGSDRRAAILQVEALILAEDAAVALLHERVIQGEGPGVTGVVRDPRERTLITAETSVTRS